LLSDQQAAFNESMIGRTLPVLFEKPGRMDGQLHGRSPYLQSVHVDGPAELIGQVGEVRIEAASRNSLSGSLTGSKRSAA
jgi:tRNA-2-methylthio-N6-dimethylallyladenosine synthase